MTKAQRRTVIGNLLFVSVVAAGVAWLLYRTDQNRLVQEFSQPYATITILPESLGQHKIAGTPYWSLSFSILAKKHHDCTEIVIERFVHKVGDSFPIVTNRDISPQLVPASANPSLIEGLDVRMPAPLGPGDYFVLIRSTCHVVNSDGNRVPLSPPAETFVCFNVPYIRPPLVEIQRLQPVSEDCRRR